MSRLRVGIVGLGYLGSRHLEQWLQIPEVRITAIYDTNKLSLQELANRFEIFPARSFEELLSVCDAVDIVTPSVTHFELAEKAIKFHRHVFIEKPVTQTSEEAKYLEKLASEARVVVQAGHVERFNPAFLAARSFIKNPMFVEAHRLAGFKPRGTDVPVVSDLMVHDIDLVLHIIGSRIRRIHAGGAAVLTPRIDICNARLEFENGATVNLTASRISLKSMRKMRIFQPGSYISIDFIDKKVDIYQLEESGHETTGTSFRIDPGNGWPVKNVRLFQPEVFHINALQHELRSFALSVINGTPPLVSLYDGRRSLEVVESILEKLQFSAHLAE